MNIIFLFEYALWNFHTLKIDDVFVSSLKLYAFAPSKNTQWCEHQLNEKLKTYETKLIMQMLNASRIILELNGATWTQQRTNSSRQWKVVSAPSDRVQTSQEFTP